MQPSQAVILSDLDGTMFNSSGEVGSETKRAIKEFIANGGMFGISTGRAPYNALQFTRDTLINAPSIVFNGAAIYDFRDRSYSMLEYVNKSAIRNVIGYCLENIPQLNIQIYLPNEIVYVSDPAFAQADFLRLHQPCRFISLSDADELPWVKSLLFGTSRETELVEQIIKDSGFLERVGIVHSYTDIVENAKYLELIPKTSGKDQALLRFKKLDEIKGRKIIGVGDYYNDAAFMKCSDFSVAPENAIEDVKNIADYIGPDNDHDLIAYIIRQLIPTL